LVFLFAPFMACFYGVYVRFWRAFSGVYVRFVGVFRGVRSFLVRAFSVVHVSHFPVFVLALGRRVLCVKCSRICYRVHLLMIS
jgi:hypothetical protein